MKLLPSRRFCAIGLFTLLAVATVPAAVWADADDVVSPNSSSLGLQPLQGTIPAATPAPGESAVFQRADGAYQAIPPSRGRIRIFHIVERDAPWTLQARADRYGEHLQRRRARTHARGASKATRSSSTTERLQRARLDSPARRARHSRRRWTASPASRSRSSRTAAASPTVSSPISRARSSTTRMTTRRCSTRDSTVRSSWSRRIRRRRNAAWRTTISRCFRRGRSRARPKITSRSTAKNIPRRARSRSVRGERFRIRWINISGENFHTMHTHGHYQQIVARDAAPVDYRDVEDTVL